MNALSTIVTNQQKHHITSVLIAIYQGEKSILITHYAVTNRKIKKNAYSYMPSFKLSKYLLPSSSFAAK
jgi:hypothetical protein